MHKKLKTTLIFLFICIPSFLLSQEKSESSALNKSIQHNTTSFTTNADFKKAQSYFFNNHWDSTLVLTTKVLSTSAKDEKLIDYCHFFRGISFFEKKLFKKAEDEFLKISKNFQLLPNVKAKLGSIALESYLFEKALSYYKEVEKIPKLHSQTINMEHIKDNIGICYLHLQKYEKAKPYLLESVRYQEEQKDTVLLIGSYGNLATLYYDLYKDNLAIPLFQKAYALAKTTNDFSTLQTTTENMAVVEENRKDYKKALQYRKEYEQWTDSLNDQNKIYATAKAEEKIAVEKEQKRIVKLEAEKEIEAAERDTFLYSAIILFVMLGVSLYFYRAKVKRNKIIHQQKENLDALNTTKDKLFSIVSHDLRSSVNAIKTSNKKLIKTLESEKRSKVNDLLQNNSAIVNNAYTLLDNLLNWALLQTDQTFFRMTNLQLYNTVEHVAYNYTAILADKEISFENTVPKNETIYADKESLKIILRNLIDNAIKFSHSKDQIRIYTKNDATNFCHLIVEDTGIGMDTNTRQELLKDTTLLAKKQHENIIGTGLGMQLCKSMIKKNNGTFSIESELGKGTKMIISLPKKLI
ncbi:tetratricopeptide repeat-containing sensor histidine kinase [uncultured Kordia sp.]|uniref:tetratricopeptide repeat-containing sensor histidine kinase n=1 Tax=uncultured Kordia sp. TaxID=507699 RepID=UPI002632094C|nr:tetratricopeptide repeat-containing sensor histidine kinase [uncultured Kordia sp.]